MSSSAGPATPPSPWSPLPPGAGTDPSGFDAVESLFRADGSGPRSASGVRPFVPALRPPEGTDGYGWLYRAAEPLPPGPEPAVAVTTTTGGLAVLDAPPAVPWSAERVAAPRRWPVLLLLLSALLCTALVALLAAGGL